MFSYIFGVIIFIFSICLAVALHELGHLYFAKKFGAYVSEYMIGFGKPLYTKKIGETVYGIKLILLGGYVRIAGMFAPGVADRKQYNSKGELTIAEQGRRASMDEIPEQYQDRAFYLLSAPKKIVIMLAGPVMNLLLCIVSVTLVFGLVGVNQPSTTIAEVPKCISATSTNTKQSNEQCQIYSPAYKAQMLKGDKIVALNGVKVDGWQDFKENLASATTDKPVSVTVDRQGEAKTLEVNLVQVNGENKIGIASQIQRVRGDFSQVLPVVNDMAWRTFSLVIKLPLAVYDLGYNWYMGNERNAESVTSIVGVANVYGDIAQAKAGILDKIASMLMIFGSLNMALFVFNMLPITPLDGGHILTAVYEGLKKTLYCRVLKKKFEPVDNAKLLPVTYVVAGIFIAMTIFLVLVDIFNPITI